MNIDKILEVGQQEQIRRDVRDARTNASAALLGMQQLDEKLNRVLNNNPTMAKAHGGDPGEVSRLKTQIRSLEARLAQLEQGQTRHATRLDKHLTRSKAHGARLGHLESTVLAPMAKAAEAKQEKRLEQFAFESQSKEILAKAENVMDSLGFGTVVEFLRYGMLEEAQTAVNETEQEAREIAEAKAEAARDQKRMGW